MRTLILFVLTLAAGCAAADDAADAGAKIHQYFDVFNDRDKETVANDIYATPVHIGGGSGHGVLVDPQAAIINLTNLYEQIDAQGWKESVIENLQTCLLSDSLALVDTRYSRMDNDGEPIPPAIRTTLYVLQKVNDDWRIVAFYAHDNDKRPTCNKETP